MQSLWLRIQQLDETSGDVALFDGVFPSREKAPIKAERFSLARLATPEWKDRETAAKSATAPAGLFDDFGNDLRTLLAPSVLAEWKTRRLPETRTYLEITRSDTLPSGVPRLADLPWEYLAEVKSSGLVDRYFADTLRPMLRVFPGDTPSTVSHGRQLNVLVLTGEAVDWMKTGFPGDDVSAVLRELQRSETCAHAELLQTPLLDEFQKVFERLKPDIIHFTGHGMQSPRSQRPALQISSPSGRWWWDTDGLYTFFSNQPHKPRLLVLNACDAAAGTGSLYSVLEALMASGIPAVIAPQAPILQDVTGVLSQSFYGALLEGKAVDVALTQARLRIGQGSHGAGWRSRDWGLPVLGISVDPETLFAARSKVPDPVEILKSCVELREFMRKDGLPAPFVGLSWPKERWDTLDALRTSNCLVISGPEKGGKSWLVKRTLRDAIQIGHRVKYVAVCGGGNPANGYADLLGAIVQGDATVIGSEIHKPLDASCFKEFEDLRAAKSPAEQVIGAFERGLQQFTKDQELTVVLDEFERKASVKESFPAREFEILMLPLFLKIARGAIKNLRLIIVVRDELFEAYGLAALPGKPIQLKKFQRSDVSMLFHELCRFYHTARLTIMQTTAEYLVEDMSEWDTIKLELMRKLVQNQVVP